MLLGDWLVEQGYDVRIANQYLELYTEYLQPLHKLPELNHFKAFMEYRTKITGFGTGELKVERVFDDFVSLEEYVEGVITGVGMVRISGLGKIDNMRIIDVIDESE